MSEDSKKNTQKYILEKGLINAVNISSLRVDIMADIDLFYQQNGYNQSQYINKPGRNYKLQIINVTLSIGHDKVAVKLEKGLKM